jgi:hypothetical protein
MKKNKFPRELRLFGVMTSGNDESVTLSFGKYGFYKMKTKDEVRLLIEILNRRSLRASFEWERMEPFVNSLLWCFGFDHEKKELTVGSMRDEQLTFRNTDEVEWFISDLKDCIQLWNEVYTSQGADFYMDLPDAIVDIPSEPHEG